MNKFTLPSTSLAAMLVALLPAAPAQAQSTSYLSNAGGGTACTLISPCNQISDALAATNANGTILCLNSSDYGGSTATKSVTIDCSGTSSSMGLSVNTPGISVTVRSVRMDDGHHVIFLDGAALVVENCVFAKSPFANTFGIDFRPKSPGAELVVTDSQFDTLGDGSSGGGIRVSPQTGAASAVVMIDRVTVANSSFGIVADGSASTAGINMTVRNSGVHRNTQDGIVATTVSGGAPIGILITNTASLSNNNGIRATGPGVTVRADTAKVSGNGTGLVVNNGASLLSFGNNNIVANGVNGAFSGSVALQ